MIVKGSLRKAQKAFSERSLFVLWDMLSIEKCRKIDPRLRNLPDEEVLEIVSNLYEMAELTLERWKKSGSKNHKRLLQVNARTIQ